MPNILLAITGLSPQVITETLYALHQQQTAVNEIHVITTRIGREQIHAHLLASGGGQFYRYLDEYGIDKAAISFSHQHLHVICDENGIEIDDISSEEENEILLKKCLELSYRYTSRADTAVFFSIAGGRKTMSACLMVAAQMYARPQDRIYHVLVSPEFESSRDFYYPPKKSIPLELRDAKGQRVIKETTYADVKLVPIPFISVRNSIEGKRRGLPQTPAQLMRFLIKDRQYPLIVNMKEGKVIYKKAELKMMPSRLALYTFFIWQKQQCRMMGASCRNCSACYLDYQDIAKQQDKINELYQQLAGHTGDAGICRLEKDSLRVYISKIRQDIQHAFGLPALAQLAVEAVGKKPDKRYGIKMERSKIQLVM